MFPAGVRLAAAEQVASALGSAGDAAAIVARLVRASMLTRTDRPSGARFVPLETVRAFGLDQLRASGELTAAQEAMIGWALRFAADAEAGGHTPDEPFWDDLVHRELPNLRAVRRQLVDQDRLPELAALLRGLHYWAGYRDVSEVWRWQLDLAQQAQGAPAEVRGPALVMAATAAWRSGRLDLAQQHTQELHDLAPTGWVGTHTLDISGTMALFAGDFEEAIRLWTTLRNAAELLLGGEDETAVRIWAAAHADPQAAILGDAPAGREAQRRAEVVELLGPARVRELEAEAAATPRAQIAEDAARALARLPAPVRGG